MFTQKKLFSFLTIAIFTSVLIGCEGGTTFTKTIDNKSSESISVRIYTDFGSGKSFNIGPGSATEVFWNDQMGMFTGDDFTCTQLIDSIQITISGNKQLVKDPMVSSNWIRESKNGRNSREDCTFIVTDNDLQ
jgi:hypothetical protein